MSVEDDGCLEYMFGAPLVDGAASPFDTVTVSSRTVSSSEGPRRHGWPAAVTVYTGWQKTVSALVIHYWTNFIKTGRVLYASRTWLMSCLARD